MKIIEFSEGSHIETKLMIVQIKNGVTNKGANYLSLLLQDSSAIIDAKYWNVAKEDLERYHNGMICLVKGDVIRYSGQLQLRVSGLEIEDIEKEDLSEYVRSSNISKEQLIADVEQYINSLKQPVYQAIVKEIMAKHAHDFYDYPAASVIHHNFAGGLATHVLGMLKLGEFMANSYPLLDHDLLISGIILHDIGKLRELSGPVVTEYTLEGKLIGHISIMQAEVSEAAEQLGYADAEETTLLRHMILSHHGEYEFGSPVKPLLPEAEILNYIDNIDARMNIIEKAFEMIAPGEFTPKQFALENRSFYKARNK